MVDEQTISEVQEIYLKLIELSSYNDFDGERVAHDLRAHRDLWDAAIMFRYEIGMILRDLPDGDNNVDTLYLRTTRDRFERLRALTKDWRVDEMDEVPITIEEDDPNTMCLRLWWD